jgi:hypothetical protein
MSTAKNQRDHYHRRAGPLETVLEKDCCDWLSTRRIFHFRTHTGKRPPAHRGVSDLFGVLPGGRAFACEIKRPTGNIRPAQWVFLENVREAGGLAMVVTSVEELRDYFSEYVR